MSNFDGMKAAVEAVSGGKNTVILDEVGMPDIVVRLNALNSKNLDDTFTDTISPAFVLNGGTKKAVYMSKYQNITMTMDGVTRAYSLPLKDPRTYVTFDQALAACRAKGEGWGLNPAVLWSMVALWAKKNGTMPRGNNNYGKDHAYTHEHGTEAMKDGDKTERTLTGSGPDTWNHNWLPDGICDMNGNVWEWVAGMRLNNGEIQIIPYANCMDPSIDMSASSSDWRAILEDGTLVEPGTSGTLKYDYVSGKITLCKTITTAADAGRGTEFQQLATASGITVPQIIKELTLMPNGTGYEGDYFYMNNSGERLPVRGGYWTDYAGAGVFSANVNYPRSNSYRNVGFRSAFYGEL